VSIVDGMISAVGNRAAGEGTLHDLGDVVLMPGLVNTHTHLEFSQLDEPLGNCGMPLPDWIRLVIAGRRGSSRNPTDAVEAGLRQSCRHGVTTLGEIATGDCYGSTADGFPQQVLFQEVIGFSAARIESVLTDTQQRLENSRDLIDRRRAGRPGAGTPRLAKFGLSPHAPYTVHPQLLERLVDLACRQQMPVAMHLAESPEELELLDTASGPFRELLVERSMWDENAIPLGTKPLDYLKVLARAPISLAVHGNYFSAEEIDFLATQRERMSVVYCPRTHDYFAHAAYPLEQMLKAGLRVALGTDSRASNPDLSLLGEMRFLASRYPDIAPAQILAMGTLAGAKSLGWENKIGSIVPGKQADLVAIACEAKCREPEAAVLHCPAVAIKTWLRGRLQ